MHEMSCKVRAWAPKIIALWALAALMGAIFVAGPSLSAQEGVGRPSSQHALGSVPCAGSIPLGGQGNPLDVQATIIGLQTVGYKCYALEINGAPPNTLGDFDRLLPAAQAAGISIFAVLPSPGHSRPAPYDNYVRWMEYLAKLSLRYPVLRGVSIEDFLDEGNPKTITQEGLTRIYDAKQKINPKFLFLPSVFELDRSVADHLAGHVDGVWFWWTNLDFTNNMRGLLADTRLAVAGRFPIYCGVYAHWTSWHTQGAPWPRVFRRSLEIGCHYSDGVVVWNIPLTFRYGLTDSPLQDVVQEFMVGGSSKLAGKCGVGTQSAENQEQ